MNDKQFIEQVRAKPSLYGLDGTYYPTAMFLLGYDLARSGGLLRGFNEWLSVRRGELSSQHWLTRVVMEVKPKPNFRGFEHLHLTHEEEGQLVEQLFSLIIDFLAVRDSPRELASMYSAYNSLVEAVYSSRGQQE